MTAACLGLVLLLGQALGRGPVRGRGPALLSLPDLAEKSRPAVVHVRGQMKARIQPGGARTEGLATSVGSGFIVDRAGWVVTNEHVVRGALDLRISLFDGREFSACVAGSDETTDVALLKINAHGPLAVLPLGDSDAIRVGETVAAFGSPFGFAHSMSAGIVSAKDRVIPQDKTTGVAAATDPPYSFYMQTDASINMGNSGGPLVDAYGAAMGINAAYWGGQQPSQGVGFAIPINVVKLLLPRLRDVGHVERSWLGADFQVVTADLAAGLRLGSVKGSLVAFVEPGSAAAAAGIEIGDVVTSFAGHGARSREELRIYAQLTPPGTKVKMGLWRNGNTLERIVTTVAVPRSASVQLLVADGNSAVRCRGRVQGEVPPLPQTNAADALDVGPLTDRARALPDRTGVEVLRVHEGAGPVSGIDPGDLVLRVGAQVVRNPDEYRQAVDSFPPGRPVPLLIERSSGRQFWATLANPEGIP